MDSSSQLTIAYDMLCYVKLSASLLFSLKLFAEL